MGGCISNPPKHNNKKSFIFYMRKGFYLNASVTTTGRQAKKPYFQKTNQQPISTYTNVNKSIHMMQVLFVIIFNLFLFLVLKYLKIFFAFSNYLWELFILRHENLIKLCKLVLRLKSKHYLSMLHVLVYVLCNLLIKGYLWLKYRYSVT